MLKGSRAVTVTRCRCTARPAARAGNAMVVVGDRRQRRVRRWCKPSMQQFRLEVAFSPVPPVDGWPSWAPLAGVNSQTLGSYGAELGFATRVRLTSRCGGGYEHAAP